MEPVSLLVVAVIGYLLGSISFARLIPRIVDPEADLSDISLPVQDSEERMPMLAMGANTASIKYGSKVGCSIGLLDMLKVFIPTLAFRLLYPGESYYLVAATAGFIGHCWPIYYGFKGGRGISPFYGALFAIDPLGALVVASLGMFIGMVLFKELLVAYTGGVFLTIVWFAITSGWGPLLIYSLVINVLFIVALIPEIKMMREMRQKYGKGDMRHSMSTFPMGQAMLKLMQALKIQRK
jgi:acyl phosphate:glycerol-3-phosphate acyltransferase